MTDEKLIDRLRCACYLAFDDWCLSTAPEAADRIEALTEQLAAARQDAKEAEAYAEELEKERDALEAKLAKAVEALEDISGNGNAAGRNPQLMSAKALATLAEIKGESHD